MSGELSSALAQEVTALAFCWKLTRADGVVLGFTSHDQSFLLGGVRYQSRPGMTPSAVSINAGLEPDSMSISGALASAAVSAFDLDAGRWEGGRTELFVCDWTDPGKGFLLLMRGFIGNVSRLSDGRDRDGGAYAVELVSETVKLARGGAPVCSPLCRAELGDRRCGVDMAGRLQRAVALSGGRQTLALEQEPERPEDFQYGRVRFVTGPLTGSDLRIEAVVGRDVILEQDLRTGGIADVKLLLFEGCDKRFETCSGRFGNGAAFDGEPHVPGNDALMRYGGI